MKNFKPVNPNIIEQPAHALFTKLGKEILQISFLGRGEGSVVFKIVTTASSFCLKTPLFPERSNKILNEAKIRGRFIKQGLAFIPAPIYVDQEYFNHGAVIYDYIEGNHSKFDSISSLQQIAKKLAQIHNLDFKIQSNNTEQTMANYDSLQNTMQSIRLNFPYLMNNTIAKAFDQALQEYEIYLHNNKDIFRIGLVGLLHGDVINNFITDHNGKIWFIDWESSGYGDILEEIFTFVYYNNIEDKYHECFYKFYKEHFPPAQSLDLEKIGQVYIQVIPAFDLCWGMDQLAYNLAHQFEPERKLRDITLSANTWNTFFSTSTSNLIKEGVGQLTAKLIQNFHLDPKEL